MVLKTEKNRSSRKHKQDNNYKKKQKYLSKEASIINAEVFALELA